jgi:molecular chaperone GrpE
MTLYLSLLVVTLLGSSNAFLPSRNGARSGIRLNRGWFGSGDSDGTDFKEKEVTSKEIDRLLKKIEAIESDISNTLHQREKDEATLKDLDAEYGGEISRVKKEFSRMKERSWEEAQEEGLQAKSKALVDVLPITDNYFRAKPLYMPLETDNEKAIQGAYDDVFNEFQKVLEGFGVTKVTSLGQPFDFNTMEAIMTAPSTGEYEKGVVCTEYQVGYMMGDKCIRPAMVVVAD